MRSIREIRGGRVMHVTINFPLLRGDDERPTCGLHKKSECEFLRFNSFGSRPFCAWVDADLFRRDSEQYGKETGYITPHPCCPIWHPAEYEKRKQSVGNDQQ